MRFLEIGALEWRFGTTLCFMLFRSENNTAYSLDSLGSRYAMFGAVPAGGSS